MIIDWAESYGYSTTLAQIFDSVSQFGGTVTTVESGQSPSGGSVLQVAYTSGGQFFLKSMTARSTKFEAFRFRVSTSFTGEVTIFRWFESGTIHCDLRVTDAGALKVTRNGTTLATSAAGIMPLNNTWKHIETKLVIHDSTGTVDVWVDSVSVISASGLDTRNGGTGVIDQTGPCINVTADSVMTFQFCDNVSADSQINQARVDYFPPTGAGTSAQFTPTAGSNFQTVDETGSPNTSDYNASSTVGHIDSFAMGDVPATAVIIALGQVALVNKQDSGSATVNFVNRQSTTNYNGTPFSPPFGSNQYFREWFPLNPDTAAQWTPAQVNANEIGYKRAA